MFELTVADLLRRILLSNLLMAVITGKRKKCLADMSFLCCWLFEESHIIRSDKKEWCLLFVSQLVMILELQIYILLDQFNMFSLV